MGDAAGLGRVPGAGVTMSPRPGRARRSLKSSHPPPPRECGVPGGFERNAAGPGWPRLRPASPRGGRGRSAGLAPGRTSGRSAAPPGPARSGPGRPDAPSHPRQRMSAPVLVHRAGCAFLPLRKGRWLRAGDGGRGVSPLGVQLQARSKNGVVAGIFLWTPRVAGELGVAVGDGTEGVGGLSGSEAQGAGPPESGSLPSSQLPGGRGSC